MRHHKLLYSSSYDRGLDILLYLWGDIRERYPDAELHICYGWGGFDARFKNNPERMQWKQDVEMLMDQEGVYHYGRVSKQELKALREKCGIWAYPTYFTEIFCINALEAQADGCVPVVCNFKHNGNYTALNETVKAGIKVEGNIRKPRTQEKFKKELLDLMGDKKRWEKLSKEGIEFAKQFTWDKQAKKWDREFKSKISKPFVSVLTPTIRKGFWNIMAYNLSKQTYDNFEWVVIDDYKEDRKKTMKKYCSKHGIKNWQYIRHTPQVKRKYALSSANNAGIKASKGELLVWLQDFVLIPTDGIERLVDIYRHHPYDFIAPVDTRHLPTIKPDTDSEDWFHGKIEVLGKQVYKNVRMKRKGIRYSDTVSDLELNYGAIPKKLIDDLNGFWEFYDDALGFDDTEIVYRGFELGARLVVDDTNVARCIDHWEALKDKPEELGKNRHKNFNDPRYFWMVDSMEENKLPVKRSQKIDNKLKLDYEIPDVSNPEKWMKDHLEEIINSWKGIL
jgi:glycosyltransferase involved in cell wall biosynthesis